MKLYYKGVTRDVEGQALENLKRKGWLEMSDVKPQFDNKTQSILNTGIALVDGIPTVNYLVRELTNEEKFYIKVNEGFDTGLGYRLALRDADRNAFAQYSILLKQGQELGLITEEQQVPIKDQDGVMHFVTVAEYKQISFAYGMYFASIWQNK